MNTTTTTLTPAVLRASWRHWLFRQSPPAGPRWLMHVWPFVYAGIVALPFTLLGFILYANGEGAWRNLAGWAEWYGRNFVVSLSITYAIIGMFNLMHRVVGLDRIRAMPSGRRSVMYTTASLLGVAIGWPIGIAVQGGRIASFARMDGNSIAATLALMLLVSWAFHAWFSLKRRELTAELQAQQARMQLLQGQIEPHFLFNTLANVISLIEADPPRARHTLEAFTDWLRASLGHLRSGQGPLAAELELTTRYLAVMQARMGEERLQVQVDVADDCRAALLPPLMLQPLVENAITHGIEPSIRDGRIRISARRDGARLLLAVEDNGLDWDGATPPPARRGSRSNGVALANLRERLQAQFGSDAQFALQPLHPGTRAALSLPWQDTPASR